MSASELQESIIQKVLQTNDIQLLDFLNRLLSSNAEKKSYKLSDFEKKLLEESHLDYKEGRIISGDDVFNQNEKWLEE